MSSTVHRNHTYIVLCFFFRNLFLLTLATRKFHQNFITNSIKSFKQNFILLTLTKILNIIRLRPLFNVPDGAILSEANSIIDVWQGPKYAFGLAIEKTVCELFKIQKEPLEMFYTKGVLKNLAKYTRKHVFWSLVFNKVFLIKFI